MSNKYLTLYDKQIDDTAEKFMRWTKMKHSGYIGAAAVIGVAAIADLWMDVNESNHARRTELIQEANLRKKTQNSLSDRWVGLEDPMQYNGVVQNMFNNRTGHSNTWGGVRY